MKYELKQMQRQGSGAIVNNSSIAGLAGFPGAVVYVTSEHDIVGLAWFK